MVLGGIVGYAGSGKTTVARTLVSRGFTELSFASRLKDVVSVLHGLPRDKLEGDTVSSREWRETFEIRPGYTPRAALQKVGDAMRGIYPDIWLDIVEKSITESPGDVVVTDCRYAHEVEMIKRNGGRIVRVVRNPPPAWEALAQQGVNPNDHGFKVHSSEYALALLDADVTLVNDGTLKDLDTQVSNFFLGGH